MSIKAITWAFEQKTGSSSAKLVLIKLADNASDDGDCWPSMRYIEKHTELSHNAVAENIKRLKKSGFLTVVPRRIDGVSLSNIYKLNVSYAPVGQQAGEGRASGGGGVGQQDDTNHKIESSKNLELPPNLNYEGFFKAWQEWLAYRKERHLPAYKPIAVNKALEWLSGIGVENAIKSINQSIKNNWQGLFEPKTSFNQQPKKQIGRLF